MLDKNEIRRELNDMANEHEVNLKSRKALLQDQLQYIEYAERVKSIYDAFVAAGFSETEAMHFTTLTLNRFNSEVK